MTISLLLVKKINKNKHKMLRKKKEKVSSYHGYHLQNVWCYIMYL